MSAVSSFRECLSGANAFYNAADYQTSLENMDAKSCVKPDYETTIQKRSVRIAKAIFSVILFPWGIGRLLHRAASPGFLPACFMSGSYADNLRKQEVLNSSSRIYKRICVKVDGMKIDGMIIGTKETLANGKWILPTLGNGQIYEESMDKADTVCQLAEQTGSNLLLFNYAGVGRSSGWASRRAAVKSYRAMLKFLEEKEKGIGATQIISYGHSFGGGVQSEALKKHKTVEGIQYAFIKSRTFSNLRRAGAGIAGSWLGAIIKIFGWNLGSPGSLRKLAHPEIILQTAQYDEVVHDGVISAKASLHHRLDALKTTIDHLDKKVFIKISEMHNDDLNAVTMNKVVNALKTQGLSVSP